MSRQVASKTIYCNPDYTHDVDLALAEALDKIRRECPRSEIDIDGDWEEDSVDELIDSMPQEKDPTCVFCDTGEPHEH